MKVMIYILTHASLVLLVLAFIISSWIVSCYGKHRPSSHNINTFISYIMLLPIGIAGLWAFIFHAFFPTTASYFIGWHPSPFEFEVAAANLGLGLLGLFSFHASKGFRHATALFTTCFLWGAAAGHIRQMVIHHNFSSGNAGTIFYTDITIPIVLIVLLILYNARSKHVFMTR